MNKHIHMVGIGGIGMSALAQLYVHVGYVVSGSDRADSPIIDLLRGKGVSVTLDQAHAAVPEQCDLVVCSDAVPEDNPERRQAHERGIRACSYYEALGEATAAGTSIVVSGTHGKTTTTAMLAKVLVDAGKNPTVICGSIMSEFGSNFRAGRSDLFVVEGCEYMRHFLNLHPTIAVVTNIEFDHTDYYEDVADMQEAFGAFITRVPEGGVVVANSELPTVRSVLHHAKAKVAPYQETTVPTLQVPGSFNEENAHAAKAAAYALDPELSEEVIDGALAAFTGTWRRFEYKGTTKEGAKVYDDYAHHPTAVAATVRAARDAFPGKRLVVAFHPHLYTRTRDFMDEFATALAGADEVLLAPIYAAREKPIEGVTSEVLAHKTEARGTPAHTFDSLRELESFARSDDCRLTTDTLLITMGAGDIYTVADVLVSN